MNNTIEEFLKTIKLRGSSVWVYRSILEKYIASSNGDVLNPDSAVKFLRSLEELPLVSLNPYKSVIGRFLSWGLGFKVVLSYPWTRDSQVRKRMRESWTFTRRNGKQVVIKGRKRPRPDNVCELCGNATGRLEYHHWDDNDMMRGIWLCPQCHNTVVRLIDNHGLGGATSLIERYILLKVEIDSARRKS